jgi:hypothetical protein
MNRVVFFIIAIANERTVPTPIPQSVHFACAAPFSLRAKAKSTAAVIAAITVFWIVFIK